MQVQDRGLPADELRPGGSLRLRERRRELPQPVRTAGGDLQVLDRRVNSAVVTRGTAGPGCSSPTPDPARTCSRARPARATAPNSRPAPSALPTATPTATCARWSGRRAASAWWWPTCSTARPRGRSQAESALRIEDGILF